MWPILVHYLIEEIRFPWTLRIVGFICLGMMLISTVLIVERGGNGTQVKQLDKKRLKKELLSPIYVMVTVGFTFAYLGMFIPFYYLPQYGMAYGMSSAMGNYLLAILNAGSFFGRIISGFLADNIGGFVFYQLCFFSFFIKVHSVTLLAPGST